METWQYILALVGGFNLLMLLAMIIARACFGVYDDDDSERMDD